MNTQKSLKLFLLFLVLAVLATLALAACTPVPGVFEVDLATVTPAAVQPTNEQEPATKPAPQVIVLDPRDQFKPLVLAILHGSSFDRMALTHFTSLACTTADGLGGPPKCLEGEADGTIIEAILSGGPESHFMRRAEFEQTNAFDVKGLYAIYRVPADPNAPIDRPTGEYALVFERTQNDYPLPVIAYVTDGKLVSLDFKLGIYPADLIKDLPLSDIVVAPTEIESWLGESEILSQTTVGETGGQSWSATSIVVYNPNGGEPMYRNLTISTIEWTTTWTVIDEFLPNYGLGFTVPLPLYWSPNQPIVYWTNTPTPDGCAIFTNGFDLHKLNLTTGESTQLLAEGGLWLAVSPTETEVAFVRGTQLTLHTFDTGEARAMALPEGQAGQIVWAPSGNQLALTIADNPCGDPALNTFSVLHVDTETLTVTTLIDHSPDHFSTQWWSQEDALIIADKDGITYRMNPQTGQYWYDDGRVGSTPGWLVYGNPAVAYTFEYPETWTVGEGLTQANQEIVTTPPDGEAFVAYFSVSVDERTLEQIQAVYAETDAQITETQFAGQDALQYTDPNSSRVEYFVSYQGKIYLIRTDKADLPEVQHILASFMFNP